VLRDYGVMTKNDSYFNVTGPVGVRGQSQGVRVDVGPYARQDGVSPGSPWHMAYSRITQAWPCQASPTSPCPVKSRFNPRGFGKNEAAVVATVNGALTPRRSRSRPQLIAKYQRPQRDACEAHLADLMRAYPEGPP
jgi:hypothetical protein